MARTSPIASVPRTGSALVSSDVPRNKLLQGDVLEQLRTLPDCSIHMCVTSPPYWALRDYGIAGQLGLEKTPEEYINKMVEIFREVKRVLRDDGTLWLNIGDSYAGSGKGAATHPGTNGQWKQGTNKGTHDKTIHAFKNDNYKSKDIIGIPWMLAFALRADGWYLRSDIIWHKPNPMPESVTDRPTKSHEYIFLLTKSKHYFYDAEAISEVSEWFAKDSRSKNGRTPHKSGKSSGEENQYKIDGVAYNLNGRRNKRSVWTIPTQSFPEAHFATFPEELPFICIKAGSKEGDIVLDPFSGAGTSAVVAKGLGRDYIGIELNPAYITIANNRLRKEFGFFHSH